MKATEISYYGVLYEVAKAVNSTLAVNEVLNSIGESTIEVMKAKGCSGVWSARRMP